MPGTNQLLRLAAIDNVLVATTRINAGTRVNVGEHAVVLLQTVSLGHKVAATAIAQGETIYKYGAPIGRATRAIGPGEHVHIQNVASNYTPTHTIEDAESTASP